MVQILPGATIQAILPSRTAQRLGRTRESLFPALPTEIPLKGCWDRNGGTEKSGAKP